MNERIYHSKLQKSGLSTSLDECKKHEKNIKGIPNYGMFKSFADESFRMIDDDKDGNKSDSKKKNSVESDSDDFDFIYDEKIALVVE